MNKRTVLIGIALLVLGIIAGALGAHALKELISEQRLFSFETGVRYQIYHGMAFLVIGLNSDKFKFSLKYFNGLIIIGVLFFCGSIYLLSLQEVLTNMPFLGPITPLGGVLLISGWLILFVQLLKSKL